MTGPTPTPFSPTVYVASLMAAVSGTRGGVAFTADPPANVMPGTGVVARPGAVGLGLNHDNQVGLFNGTDYEWVDPILYWPFWLQDSDGAGTPSFLYFNGTDWVSALPAGSRLVPTGAQLPFGGVAAPAGYVLCDGATYDGLNPTYAALYAVLGKKYGADPGGALFNVPDKRGRGSVGKGVHVDVDAVGKTDAVALAARRPNHLHGVGTIATSAHAGTAVADHSYTPAGANSAPTFTGAPLGTHTHAVTGVTISAHAGTAVADHAAHTHQVTAAGTNSAPTFAGSALATHTHTVTPTGTNSAPTFTGSALATHNHGGATGTPSATQASSFLLSTGPSSTHTHAITAQSAGTPAGTVSAPAFTGALDTTSGTSAGTPAGTVSAPVFTGSAVTSGNPSATLVHVVTQPSPHTLGGAVDAASAGTPAGMVSAPAFTGTPATLVHVVTQPSAHTLSGSTAEAGAGYEVDQWIIAL